MNLERNLLVAGLAVQAGLIDAQQFAEACRLCEEKPDQFLEDLLVERGWMIAADRPSLTYLLERALHKHDGNARAALGSLALTGRQSLAAGPVSHCRLAHHGLAALSLFPLRTRQRSAPDQGCPFRP